MSGPKCESCGSDYKRDRRGNCGNCGAELPRVVGVFRGQWIKESDLTEKIMCSPEFIAVADYTERQSA